MQPAATSDAGSAALGPVAPAERIETLDVLRGFALFGVLLVNMEFFASPTYLVHGDLTQTEMMVTRLVRFLAEAKFYTLFSFLFGYGAAIQLSRAAGRVARPAGLFARRMGVLLLIGLAHAFCLWVGDILVTYAILGFVLLAFRNCRPRTLVCWAVPLLLLSTIIIGGLVGLVELARFVPETAAKIERELRGVAASEWANMAAMMSAYSAGSPAEVTGQHLSDLRDTVPFLLLVAPSVLGLFLLGYAAGRAGLLSNTGRRLGGKWLALAIPLALVANAVYTAVFDQVGTEPDLSWWLALGMLAMAVGAPALAALYLVAVARLVATRRAARLTRPLAAVGRMALTNYVAHSVLGVILFTPYGFGLYGGIRPAVGLGLTLAIYAAQMILSEAWLSRFRFGPLEWLWRSCTYGRAQPFLQ